MLSILWILRHHKIVVVEELTAGPVVARCPICYQAGKVGCRLALFDLTQSDSGTLATLCG